MWHAPLTRLPQGEAHGTRDHHTLDDSISYPDMFSKWKRPTFRRPPMVCSDALSGHLFSMDSKELSSILDCFGDQKAVKTSKLNTIWLELIARVLNMLIVLKGDNYYSKVFKRVNYKLSNSTFWVVITPPNRHIASPLVMKDKKIKINNTIIYNIMLDQKNNFQVAWWSNSHMEH